jgi:hypothetical protein
MILVVIPSPASGGAEAQTMQVARGLGAAVCADPSLGLATPGFAAPLAHDAARPAGAMHAAQLAAMRAVLARVRPRMALVCCALPNEGLGAMRALHAADVPQLGVAHLVRADWTLGAADRLMLDGLRAGWAAVSSPSARRLEVLFGLPWGTVAAVPNGLSPAAPRPRAPARRRCCSRSAGSMPARAPSWRRPLAARIAPAVLALAGKGPLAGRLAPARELGRVAESPPPWRRPAPSFCPAITRAARFRWLAAAQAGCPIIATAEAFEAWPRRRKWPGWSAAIAGHCRRLQGASRRPRGSGPSRRCGAASLPPPGTRRRCSARTRP